MQNDPGSKLNEEHIGEDGERSSLVPIDFRTVSPQSKITPVASPFSQQHKPELTQNEFEAPPFQNERTMEECHCARLALHHSHSA
ncbi:MAG: hypothetical protein R3C20_12710 [Planctomycetaceae bacterium]